MGTEVKAKKLRDDERIFQAIDKCISSRDDQYKRNKGIVREILTDVFATMKGRNAFFREQYRGFFFVENYYKGMQVAEVEEFHVNIVIDIPLKYNLIELPRGKPGYRKLRLPNETSIYTPSWDKYTSLLSTLLTKETSGNFHNLDKDAFRHSIESLLVRAMLNIPTIDNYTVNVRKNGPLTLYIMKQGFAEATVSLVPVIEFAQWPFYPTSHFHWYAVPEILQNVKDGHLQWRPALYDNENDLLTTHSYVKPVIRQIEKLRDIQAWNVITYYHIKTLFMHYAINTQDDSELPVSSKLTGIKLFIHILDELRDVCKSRDLKNCWEPAHNLIDADESQLANIVEQLTVIIREITDDPAKMADWLLTWEELAMYQKELMAIGNVEDIDGPFKSLQMSEESEPGSSKDILNTADEVSEQKMDLLRVIAGLKDTIETQSRLLTALEQISARTA